MTRTVPVVLVPGGLYQPLGPEEFWERPGVAPALRRLGYPVRTPARLDRPSGWPAEADHLEAALVGEPGPVAVVAASNGCSAALRLVLRRPDLVSQLVLCWPATGDDPEVDRAERRRLASCGVDAAAAATLIDGECQRGVRPDELRALIVPTVLVPAEPEDPHHQRRTVAALRHLLPRAAVGLGTPPSPHEGFAGHLGALVSLLDVVLFGAASSDHRQG